MSNPEDRIYIAWSGYWNYDEIDDFDDLAILKSDYDGWYVRDTTTPWPDDPVYFVQEPVEERNRFLFFFRYL